MSAIAITSPLLAASGVSHAFFTRQGGVSGGIYTSLNGGQGSADDPDHVAENRARMARFLGHAPTDLVSAYQVHSADVAVVDTPWSRESRPKVDAMVTRNANVCLGISTADCGPILFVDVQAGVIGAAHAGWKGAVSGVIEATIDAMVALGGKRHAIQVALGMMISQANYEVGPEFRQRLEALDAANLAYLVPSQTAHHSMFDLPGYCRGRLVRAGIEQIEDLALCTYADEEGFFSYRRTTHRAEPDYGRHISAISLR